MSDHTPVADQVVSLAELVPCFQGVIPSLIATCSGDGEPNVTYLSHITYVDSAHVALSCQFFNKTKRNVSENPRATVTVYHPVSFESYRLELTLDHVETSGPLFDAMATRIQVIASHTGMAGVFRLVSADVYRVDHIEHISGFLLPPETAFATGAEACPLGVAALPPGPLTELRGLQVVSERIARASDLDSLLTGALTALDELFGFAHSMVLVAEEGVTAKPADVSADGPGEPAREARGKLVAIASHGYGAAGIGAEVAIGQGLLGAVAAQRRMVRLTGVSSELRYSRAVRGRVEEQGGATRPEIPLPGLPDAQAQLGLPLLVGDRLIGVLAVESRDALAFDEWDEAFLQIVGNQIAMGIDRMQDDDESGELALAAAVPEASLVNATRKHQFVFYKNDDCVFVDGEYLIRNVPAKILWRVLSYRQRQGQVEFSNRELRLDPWLGLPAYKDNLESRLILLRKRLQAKCPDVRLVPVRRGRFAVELDCAVELVERETA